MPQNAERALRIGPAGGGLILFLIFTLAACQRAPAPAPEAASAPAEHAMQLPTTLAEWAQGAQFFDNLGSSHRTISTRSADAQRYFDQGLVLMYGFNHDEASRSFAKAAQLDPECASCYWGLALSVGPNYNVPVMSAPRAKVAFEAESKAVANAGHATEVERGLIAALKERYPNDQPLDPSNSEAIIKAYATAMRELAHRFPDDLDVQTLTAESMMNLHAWKLWGPDGVPTEGTPEIVNTLEQVLKRDPNHVGANHYYVHVMEASLHPESALPSADRLRTLVPAAGHLVHMPAHIYQRVGRYDDSVEANREAAKQDAKYNELTHPPDYYSMYSSHNYQFLAYSAAMAGRRAETIDAVDRSRDSVNDAMLLQMQGVDWYVAQSYLARVRFGMWSELLAMPAPDSRILGLRGGYLFGRVMALAATGKPKEAREVFSEFDAFAKTVPADAVAGQNLLKDVLAVAAPVMAARIAAAEGKHAEEVAQLRVAVIAEDHLSYDEPRNWMVPSRQLLGAALLANGDAKAAESTYREDLKQNPGNGWALFGLQQALEAQKRSADAKVVAADFKRAFHGADVELTASAY
jgi:tetratricopeptide (TPR) repeat protein